MRLLHQTCLLLLLLLLSTTVRAQPVPPTKPRIKILLLGTMHFTPSTADTYSNAALDLTSAQRQPQVQAVVRQLAAFQPTQVCVEWPATRQAKLDSLYQAYQQHHYQLQSDEIDQLGFQTAQQLRLPRLTAVNYFGGYNMDKVTAYAQNNGQQSVLTALDTYSKQFVSIINQQMQALSLAAFLRYVNTPASLNGNALLYTEYLVRVGAGNEYPGVDLVSGWYDTNLHIYANILRQVQPTDKAILVVFGQGHIPILKSLFASNPAFEVVEVADALK